MIPFFPGWTLLARFAVPLIVVGVVAGGIWGYGHSHYKAGERAVEKAWEKERGEQAAKIEEANMRANQAAFRYEEWKMRQKPRIVTRTVEVERVLQNEPVWSTAAVPDSVRKSIEAATADFNRPRTD